MSARLFIVLVIMLIGTSVCAGSIDCGKPASRGERAICSHPELKARELMIERLFKTGLQRDAPTKARALNKSRAKERLKCDIDLACLAWVQLYQYRRMTSISEIAPKLPAFSDKRDPFLLYFDEYAGMRITILSRAGLDTEHAVITAKHTNREICADTPVTPSMECIHEEDLRPLLRFTANCAAGTFTTLYGHDRKIADGAAKDSFEQDAIDIVDVATGGDLKTENPKAYERDFAQFRALCPGRF